MRWSVSISLSTSWRKLLVLGLSGHLSSMHPKASAGATATTAGLNRYSAGHLQSLCEMEWKRRTVGFMIRLKRARRADNFSPHTTNFGEFSTIHVGYGIST